MEKKWKKSWKSNNDGYLMLEKSLESRDAATNDEERPFSPRQKAKVRDTETTDTSICIWLSTFTVLKLPQHF